MQNNPIRYSDPLGDTLGIQFRKGFLGLRGKREFIARSEYRAAYFENQVRAQLSPPQPLRTGYNFRDASGNPQVAKLLDASDNPIYVPPTFIPPSLNYLNIKLIY